jgi:broad specificity phosphatase PhoE
MEAVARLFLIRAPTFRGEPMHETDATPIDGALDLELAPAELGCMEELIERLARRKPVALHSSPRSRSLHAARALGLRCKLSVHEEAQLEARNLGEWQGRTPASLGAAWQAFLADRSRHTGPGAEALELHEARVLAKLDQLAAEYHGREVAVVLHADALRAALSRALGLEHSSCFEPQAAQALALDWPHPAALEFKHGVVGMGFDWDVAAPATQVHKYPGGASLVPRAGQD